MASSEKTVLDTSSLGARPGPSVAQERCDAGGDFMKHVGSTGGSGLDPGTHPELHPNTTQPDSEVEGSESMGGGFERSFDKDEE